MTLQINALGCIVQLAPIPIVNISLIRELNALLFSVSGRLNLLSTLFVRHDILGLMI